MEKKNKMKKVVSFFSWEIIPCFWRSWKFHQIWQGQKCRITIFPAHVVRLGNWLLVVHPQSPILKRLKQECCLSVEVWSQPGQCRETLSQKQSRTGLEIKLNGKTQSSETLSTHPTIICLFICYLLVLGILFWDLWMLDWAMSPAQFSFILLSYLGGARNHCVVQAALSLVFLLPLMSSGVSALCPWCNKCCNGILLNKKEYY